MPSLPLSILLKGLLKMWMKKKKWWSPSLRKWMNKMTSTQPIQSCTRSQRSIRRCIGWPPRSFVMWSLSEKCFPQRLMKLIRLLGHRGLRTISWLRKPRSLKRSYSKSELNWRGLQMLSLIRCSVFKNLHLIEQA